MRKKKKNDGVKKKIKDEEKKERAEKRERNIRRNQFVTRGSAGGESIDGSQRNLIPDETRKMSARVGAYKRPLPGVSPLLIE